MTNDEARRAALEAVRQLRKAAYRLQDDHGDPEAGEMLAAADALADALALYHCTARHH